MPHWSRAAPTAYVEAMDPRVAAKVIAQRTMTIKSDEKPTRGICQMEGCLVLSMQLEMLVYSVVGCIEHDQSNACARTFETFHEGTNIASACVAVQSEKKSTPSAFSAWLRLGKAQYLPSNVETDGKHCLVEEHHERVLPGRSFTACKGLHAMIVHQ